MLCPLERRAEIEAEIVVAALRLADEFLPVTLIILPAEESQEKCLMPSKKIIKAHVI